MIDNTLKLLSKEPRRKIMYLMEDENDNVFDYEEITDGMIDQDHIPDEDAERFRIQMIHTHLPILEDNGLVENDQRSETVRYTGDEGVEELLDTIQEYESY